MISISCVNAETSPALLQKQVKNSITQVQKFQAKAEAWADERDSYINEIRELKQLKRWLTHQQSKYKTYIQKEQTAVEELKRKKKETEQIKIALEPFLDDVLVRLREFIEKDLPFLPDERQKRLVFLKDSLDNYHVGLAEKTKRILEALQVEASYGGTVERTETTINVNNSPIQVNLFRLGRLGLFYQSLDKKQVGWFSRKTAQWEPLPVKYNKTLHRAIEIAEKKRTPELLNLPVGK